MSIDVSNAIANMIGFKVEKSWGKYLDVFLSENRRVVADFELMLEKIRQGLNGLNARTLSLAGRLVLVKSILCSIPYYSMQNTKIPESVCRRIEELIRGLLW